MTTLRDAAGAHGLEARYLVADEVYQRETKRIFESQWLCLGRCPKAESGRFTRFEIEGESLLCVMGDDGQPRVFYNTCRHRGSRICEPASGQAQTFRCPYHGWTYHCNGALLGAPNMADVAGFEVSDFGLQPVASAVWQGFVMVHLGADPAPLENALPALSERFDGWSLPRLVPAHEQVYDVRANWKLLFQNYSECYHCPRVHPQLESLSPARTAANELAEGAVLGGPMQLSERTESMSTTGARCAPVLPGLDSEQRRQVYYYTIFPSLFLSPHPDYVLVHYLRRLAVDRTQVVCQWLFDPDAEVVDCAPAVEFWDQTNRQDWHVCELTQQGVSSRGYQAGPYSHSECTVAAFDRHYLSVLEG